MKIFEEFKGLTVNNFLISVFDNCERGEYPEGMTVKDNNIIVNDIKIELSIDNFKEIVTLIKTLKIEDSTTRILNTGTKEIDQQDWKMVKKKASKNNIIMTYVFSLKEQYSLTPNEIKFLLSQIQTGLQLKIISSDDVDYIDGEIRGIENLTFNEETRIFEFDRVSEPTIKEEKITKSNPLLSEIESYLKSQ